MSNPTGDALNAIGDGPIEPEFKDKMNAIAGALDDMFNGNPAERLGKPRTVGFILLTFKFGEQGRCNYISNADRKDVITLLKEQLAYFEGMPSNLKGRA
ncbi:MAG TPA: hypothetical protein VHK27_05565 [Gammaproteobacteria bacterium]|nr:hypothetical protein [Gammaproteobacteria bacterium]